MDEKTETMSDPFREDRSSPDNLQSGSKDEKQKSRPVHILRQLPSQRSPDYSNTNRRNNSTVSTRHILANFSASDPTDDSDEAVKRHKAWLRARSEAQATIQRLKKPSLGARLSNVWRGVRHSVPGLKFNFDREELDSRAASGFYFTPRAKVPAYIVDFKADSAERYVKPLCELDQCKAYFFLCSCLCAGC